MDETVVLETEEAPRPRRRREACIATLCALVAVVGMGAVVAAPPAAVQVEASGAPAAVQPSTTWAAPEIGAGADPSTTSTVPVTTTTIVLRAERPSDPTPTPAEFEAEHGCIPGTFDPTWSTCTPHPSATVGRVTDPAGRPVPNICVHSIPDIRPVARTDTDGRYRVDRGLHYQVIFKECPDSRAAFGWVPARVDQPEHIRPGQTLTLDAVLQQAGGVRGRVVDLEGRPVAGICVATKTIDESISLATDANGSFTLAGVVPGTHPIGFNIGTTACPSVGIWDAQPDVVVTPGSWTDVTLRIQPGRQMGDLSP